MEKQSVVGEHKGTTHVFIGSEWKRHVFPPKCLPEKEASRVRKLKHNSQGSCSPLNSKKVKKNFSTFYTGAKLR